MQINVRYLENLKLEALFDDFNVLSDQPVRYKGDGTAPGPFDYFLASSAMCAAYFVLVYCKSRGIPTDDIRVTQDNIIDPENRYKQTFKINLEIPESISDKDRDMMIKAIDRCTVKKTIQEGPRFVINAVTTLGKDNDIVFEEFLNRETKTEILGKDKPLEQTISEMTALLNDLGIKIEISSWRNPVPGCWSVHIRDADSPMCYTNGKGASKDAALASALGEYLERISTNYFYADYYLGKEIAESETDFVHYPDEKWFPITDKDNLPEGLMDDYMISLYDNDGELKPEHLICTNSGNTNRGICALPYERQSDGETVYIPVNVIGNLFVSNGMSAGNTKYEARVQCLSEIFERAVKNQIIAEEMTLPEMPRSVLEKYPSIMEGINKLEERGYPVLVKDASLGGRYPVMNVTLLNPITGGVFASFGAHPKFEVALERTLTELLQGRSFEMLNEMPPPTFNSFAVTEHNNIVDHFIDSTGVVSWKFLGEEADYEFVYWDFSGTTEEEYNYLMDILKQLEKEVYIADYNSLGTNACRILVPNYSEIYLPEDLVWDNNNLALDFREDVMNVHRLADDELSGLLTRLEESEQDNFKPLTELIGIAFDENDTWGELTVGELKCLGYLALKKYEEAKEYVDLFHTFNDNNFVRRKFYQALSVVLDITIEDELNLENYLPNLTKMYGEDLISTVTKSVTGEVKFHGLYETGMDLRNQDKHQRLIESYKKLQEKRRTRS